MFIYRRPHERISLRAIRPQISRRNLRRLVATISLLLTLSAVAGVITRSSRAQMKPVDREAAFTEKADKVLKQLRRADEADRLAMAKGKLRKEQSAVEQLSRLAAVDRNESTTVVAVSVALAANSDAELTNAGFTVESKIGPMATLELGIDRVPDLAALPSVRKVSASLMRHPLNDRARQAIGIDNTAGQRIVSQTGRGVVVGIIDTGIDFRHLDFTVPGSAGQQTRIRALLDMTAYGSQSPDPNWNYTLPGQTAAIGHLYTETEINSALRLAKPADQNSDPIKERDKNGHGTHVAGTAAGNGLSSPTPGTYAGMAPEADLVIVKASRQNDGNDSFRTTDLINAMQFVQQRAAELGEPFVINLSLGGQAGPHDGTNPDERAIDTLVNGGAGRAICVAAGNDGDSNIHARSIVPAGGSQTITLNLNGGAGFIDLYQAHSDRFSVSITRPDGVSLGPVSYDANGFSLPNGQASDQYVELFNSNDDKGDGDASNDQPEILILFKSGAPNGAWQITLQDADSNPNQSYDAWGGGVTFSTYVDNGSHLLASPGTARGAITVGAFITRSASLPVGWYAPFTSPGPTADGRQKPDISAPGYYLYSVRSSDVADPNFGTVGTGPNAPTDSMHYTGLAGTSMATPVSTGAVALLLESKPSLTSEQVKDSIRNTAMHDSYTGPADWTPQLGAGKLNIVDAIQLGGRPVYTISGHVSGVAMATINLSGSQTAFTNIDASGNYRFRNLIAGGNYTVAPPPPTPQSIYQYTFSPPSYTFSNLNANQIADFQVTMVTHSISGRITGPSGNGVAGIVLGTFGNTPPVTSDSLGNYQFSNLPAGQPYDLTAFDPNLNYSLSPNHQYVGILTKDETVNFTASRLYKIRGRVARNDGTGIAGALITLLGSTITTSSTDASGNYSLTSLPEGGDYSINLYHSAYAFNPNGKVFKNLASDQIVDFVAVPAFTIEGRTLDNHGSPLAGTTVVLSGSVSATTQSTGPGGYYAFERLPQGGNYIVTPSAPGLVCAPASRTFSNLVASTFTADFTFSALNNIDNADFFVSQQYHDFLNREADTNGRAFWTNEIISCGSDQTCVANKRINVSAAFFLSTEFQQTGYLVERLYKAAYGDGSATSTSGGAHQLSVPIVRFTEFLPDTQQIGQGVVVGQNDWETVLENHKQNLTAQFVQRARFISAFPTSMTPSQFVDKLNTNAGNVLSSTDRATAIALFGGATDTSNISPRAQALRQIAENQNLNNAEFNRAFVLMQYFGYLRRNPNDAPDADYTGFDFWLSKLNQFNGNFVAAEMVKAFITSSEYRQRFGP